MPSSEWPTPEAIEAVAGMLYARDDREWIRGAWHRESEAFKQGYRDEAASLLTAAAKASPVIPAPKCETCDGEGVDEDAREASFMRSDCVCPDGYSHCPHRTAHEAPCPDCHGTGVAEVIPVAVLRPIAEALNATAGHHRFVELCPDTSQPHSRDPECIACLALADLAALLDEHTRKAPSTTETEPT